MSVLSKFPDTHLRARGRHSARLDDGTQILLEISSVTRPPRGHELVKAAMAMQMGRPSSMTVEETAITLYVGRRARVDIEVTAAGQYRAGRRFSRSLRGLCERVLSEDMALSLMPDTSVADSDTQPTFSR